MFEDERRIDASDGFELRGTAQSAQLPTAQFPSTSINTTRPPLCVLLRLTSVGGSSIGLGVTGLDIALGDDMVID